MRLTLPPLAAALACAASACSFCDIPLPCVDDESCPSPLVCVAAACAPGVAVGEGEGEGDAGEGEGEGEGDGNDGSSWAATGTFTSFGSMSSVVLEDRTVVVAIEYASDGSWNAVSGSANVSGRGCLVVRMTAEGALVWATPVSIDAELFGCTDLELLDDGLRVSIGSFGSPLNATLPDGTAVTSAGGIVIELDFDGTVVAGADADAVTLFDAGNVGAVHATANTLRFTWDELTPPVVFADATLVKIPRTLDVVADDDEALVVGAFVGLPGITVPFADGAITVAPDVVGVGALLTRVARTGVAWLRIIDGADAGVVDVQPLRGGAFAFCGFVTPGAALRDGLSGETMQTFDVKRESGLVVVLDGEGAFVAAHLLDGPVAHCVGRDERLWTSIESFRPESAEEATLRYASVDVDGVARLSPPLTGTEGFDGVNGPFTSTIIVVDDEPIIGFVPMLNLDLATWLPGSGDVVPAPLSPLLVRPDLGWVE